MPRVGVTKGGLHGGLAPDSGPPSVRAGPNPVGLGIVGLVDAAKDPPPGLILGALETQGPDPAVGGGLIVPLAIRLDEAFEP